MLKSSHKCVNFSGTVVLTVEGTPSAIQLCKQINFLLFHLSTSSLTSISISYKFLSSSTYSVLSIWLSVYASSTFSIFLPHLLPQSPSPLFHAFFSASSTSTPSLSTPTLVNSRLCNLKVMAIRDNAL